MGSHTEPHADRARPLGAWIARQGYHLLTGGGDGVMGAVTQAFTAVADRSGLALAVIPSEAGASAPTPLPGYPNRWVEVPIYTHLGRGGPYGDEPTSRNHINVLTSTVVILLPGGTGTASEARLAVRYGKPCVAHLRARDEIPGLPPEISVETELTGVTRYVAAQLSMTGGDDDAAAS